MGLCLSRWLSGSWLAVVAHHYGGLKDRLPWGESCCLDDDVVVVDVVVGPLLVFFFCFFGGRLVAQDGEVKE